MSKTSTLNRGMIGLTLAASLFLGCQEFLSEDKEGQAAETPPSENVESVTEEATFQESVQESPVKIVTPPPPPPDSAAACENLIATLATLEPSSSKYPLYQEQIAIHCTPKP